MLTLRRTPVAHQRPTGKVHTLLPSSLRDHLANLPSKWEPVSDRKEVAALFGEAASWRCKLTTLQRQLAQARVAFNPQVLPSGELSTAGRRAKNEIAHLEMLVMNAKAQVAKWEAVEEAQEDAEFLG